MHDRGHALAPWAARRDAWPSACNPCSAPMKIYIFETEKWERPSFEPLTREHDLRFVDEPLALENVSHYADAEAISTFIDSRLDGDIIDALPHLKIIASRSTGVDHIDTPTCAQRGIVVCNVPGYGETTVAEHVFGLLLTISHRLKEAIERTQRGNFSPRGLQGFDLRGKTLGVIGTGAIGRETIHIAK